MTGSLSYVLAVLASAIERRKLAQGIFGLGETARESMENAKLHDPEQSLKVYVLSLSIRDRPSSAQISCLSYSEVIPQSQSETVPGQIRSSFFRYFFLLHALPEAKRPPLGLLHVVDNSIGSYVEWSSFEPTGSLEEQTQMDHYNETAREVGAVSDGSEQFDIVLNKYLSRCELLVEICRRYGWQEK